MDVTKKKPIIKVRPHTIVVGGAKKLPDNGHPPDTAPPQPVLKKSLFRKCVDVVKEDLHLKKVEMNAILEDAPTWEEYLRFREMAKK